MAVRGGFPVPNSRVLWSAVTVSGAFVTTFVNPFLEDTLVYYDNLANRIWCLLIPRLPGMAGHVGEHGPLLEAVVAGDADRAADLARNHVLHFEQEVRALL